VTVTQEDSIKKKKSQCCILRGQVRSRMAPQNVMYIEQPIGSNMQSRHLQGDLKCHSEDGLITGRKQVGENVTIKIHQWN